MGAERRPRCTNQHATTNKAASADQKARGKGRGSHATTNKATSANQKARGSHTTTTKEKAAPKYSKCKRPFSFWGSKQDCAGNNRYNDDVVQYNDDVHYNDNVYNDDIYYDDDYNVNSGSDDQIA